MTVYYVAKTGNDSNAGTSQAAPKLTIASAVDAAWRAGTGNIVEIIDSGEYEEGDIDIFTRAITVRATGSNKPVMDGDPNNNDYAFVPYISGNVFIGLHMKNYDDGLINTGFNANAGNYTLSGCIGHFLLGPQQIGNSMAPAQSAVVRESRVISEGRSTFSAQNGKIWFNNSVIATNAAGYHVIDSAQANVNVTASFSTFLNNGRSGGNYCNVLNEVYKVINCISFGNGDGNNAFDHTFNNVFVAGDSFIAWSTNSCNGSTTTTGSGEVFGDPLFVNEGTPGSYSFTSGQSYKLSAGSPAIAAGTSYLSVTTDISGNTRTAMDMGAYAFESTDPLWTSYEKEPVNRFSAGLGINLYDNLASNNKFRNSPSGVNPKQAPFSRGIKGVPSIRNPEGDTPYKNNND